LASIVASENEFCKNPTSKDTITTIDSESYDSIGGHKHSLDQDTIHWYLDNEAWWQRIRDGAYRDYYKKQYGV
jgi:dTDP-glucose 4,6-dehydratase